MKLFTHSRTFLRDHFLMMLGVCLCVYFSYHAVMGQRSLFRLVQVNTQMEQVEHDLVALNVERDEMQRQVMMLRPESLSLDYLEELAVRDLGYYRASELALVSTQ